MAAKVSAAKSTPNNNRHEALGQLLLWRRRWGLYTRVARQLDLSPQHVQKVAIGERRSRWVEKALVDELKKIKAA